MTAPVTTIDALLVAAVEALRAVADVARASQIDPLVSCTEAGVPRKSFIKACRSGALPAVRIGREDRAKKSDVEAWVATRLPSARVEPKKQEVEQPAELDPFDAALARGRSRSVGGGSG